MRRRRAAAALLAAAGLALSACDGGDSSEALALDGSPRVPDDQGILTEITDEGITLEGERTYAFAESFRSFSTYTLKLEPVRNREGQFVHVGVDGDEATWVAGFGAPLPTDPPSVPYLGTVRTVDGRTVTFLDGSVLTVADGVEVPKRDQPITASIDPDTGVVMSWRPS